MFLDASFKLSEPLNRLTSSSLSISPLISSPQLRTDKLSIVDDPIFDDSSFNSTPSNQLDNLIANAFTYLFDPSNLDIDVRVRIDNNKPEKWTQLTVTS